jgi:ribosome-associated protein
VPSRTYRRPIPLSDSIPSVTDLAAPSDESVKLRALVEAAAQGASDRLATDIVILEVGDVIAITDYFVIASASNTRQVRRVAEEVELAVQAAGGEGSLRSEGLEDGQWVLLDFGPFVVHVFHVETREFYDIERLWSDVPRVDWVDLDAPTEQD